MPSKRLVARVCVLTGEIEAEEQRKELVAPTSTATGAPCAVPRPFISQRQETEEQRQLLQEKERIPRDKHSPCDVISESHNTRWQCLKAFSKEKHSG